MTDDLRPYPEYKDSDVPWLGETPRHWGRTHGGAVLQQKRVRNRGMIEDTVLSLSYGRIVIKPPEKLHGLVPESFETYQIVDPGDIIIRPTDLQNDWNTIRVGIVKGRGIITSAYLCFRTREPLTAEYAHLLLLGYDLKKIFYGMGSGLRQNLDWSDFKRLPILLPPPEEQRAIVTYVNRLDLQVRQFIHNRRRLIEVLNERKQAITHRAVTGGLVPDVHLKPSGVEWLGDVPEHWEVTPGRNCFFEKKQTNVGLMESTVLSLSYGNIVIRPEEKLHGLVPASFETYQIVESGDIICRPTDLQNDKKSLRFGFSKHRGIITSAYLCFRTSSRIDSYFAYLLLHTYDLKKIIYRLGSGLRQNLAWGDFKSLPCLLPPLSEQTAIVEYLEKTTADIDTAINRAHREIGLIREYRTRLIADVVTGKVDVRQVSAMTATSTATEAKPAQPKRTANVYFRRSVFAAEIVQRLHEEPTFGHVKFEKLIFLCEKQCGVDTGSTYHRQAAGPYDNRALRSIDSQMEKQKWYAAQQVEGRYQYVPLAKAGGHKTYFDRYFANVEWEFSNIIETFRTLNTQRCEIVATLYAVWEDLLAQSDNVTGDQIVEQVLHHWHPSKQEVDENRWRQAIGWMRKKGLTPKTGGSDADD